MARQGHKNEQAYKHRATVENTVQILGSSLFRAKFWCVCSLLVCYVTEFRKVSTKIERPLLYNKTLYSNLELVGICTFKTCQIYCKKARIWSFLSHTVLQFSKTCSRVLFKAGHVPEYLVDRPYISN